MIQTSYPPCNSCIFIHQHAKNPPTPPQPPTNNTQALFIKTNIINPHTSSLQIAHIIMTYETLHSQLVQTNLQTASSKCNQPDQNFVTIWIGFRLYFEIQLSILEFSIANAILGPQKTDAAPSVCIKGKISVFFLTLASTNCLKPLWHYSWKFWR